MDLLIIGGIFLFIIFFSILVHELGHYLGSKLFGIEVEEFAIGFGPLLGSVKKWNTLFSFRLLPLGGFNKILGQGEVVDKPESYTYRPYHQKLVVLLGGATMNIILAVLSFYAYILLNGGVWTIPDIPGVTPIFGEVEVSNEFILAYDFSEDSIFKEALDDDIKLPVVIMSISGEEIKDFDSLKKQLEANKDQEITVEYLEVTSETDTENLKEDDNIEEVVVKLDEEALLGINVQQARELEVDYTENPVLMVFAGFVHMGNELAVNFQFFRAAISTSVSEGSVEPVANTVYSPIGFFKAVDWIFSSRGVVGLVYLLGALNLSLAVMNLLPIPALDGGHILISTLEKVSGRRFNEEVVGFINMIGLLVLMIFGIMVMIKDVSFFGLLG